MNDLKGGDLVMESRVQRSPAPLRLGGCWRLRSLELAALGCVQSTQFRLRIGPYQSRIGPDSACFRGGPVFAGEGMQFESHLGHVFSLFRGLWAAECVQISFMGPCGGPFLLVAAGLAAPSLGLGSGVAAYSFMAGGAWKCMTCCDLGIKSSCSSLSPAGTRGIHVLVASMMFSSIG